MTTTTELALVEQPETPAPVQLTVQQAKALDKRIRAASDKVSTASDNLLNLLEQAAEGQIHEALEFASWTAWFKDAVQIQISDRFERKELVKLMSGKGMSQRAIAGSLGVSQKTVDRDLEGEEFESDTVVSLDGAERPRNGGTVQEDSDFTEGDIIEGEVVDAEEAPLPDMTAVAIVEAFNDEVANLWAAQAELKEFTREPKWGNARNRIAKANLNNLQEVITGLESLVDDLMTS